MASKITVYDGARVIGGNKVLLEAEKTRLFFDFGTSYATRYLYFEEYLSPRAGRGLLDLVEMGLLPPLWGIYREDLQPPNFDARERMMRSPLFRELQADAVLLSHAHLDHAGYVSLLRSDIPIYAGVMTALISKAIQDSGRSSELEHEVCYLTPREEKEGLLTTIDSRKQPSLGRPFHTVDEPVLSAKATSFWSRKAGTRELDSEPLQQSDRVGELRVRRFPVDHSIFGASAFAVETDSGWVVYTGDLRLHGRYGFLTESFIEEAAKLRPAAIISEGTYTRAEPPVTEEEVYISALDAVKQEGGLVIADFAPRNVERLLTFRRIAQETGRQLAILGKDAYLLEAMTSASEEVPDIAADKTLRIYRKARAKLDLWEKGLQHRYRQKLVDWQEVSREPESFILCFSFLDINELPDVNPKGGGSWIYSTSEAHSEEERIDLWRLRNWLEHFQMRFVGDYERGEWGFHASGHIAGPDILKLIRQIKPRMVIPVHTEEPLFFLDNLGREFQVCLPKQGEPIDLG